MREHQVFRLRRRPSGRITEEDLELCREPVPEIGDGQALVRTLLLSLDPSHRIWMSEFPSYMPPIPLGAVVRSLGIGEVVASRRDDLPVGTLVSGFTGFAEHCVAGAPDEEAPFTALPSPPPAPLEVLIGALGHTGITAWLGIDLAQPQPGETVVVSAAAGAVGSIAGQLAKARGARVVGIAGGPEKCRKVVDEYGFDACVDYKADDFRRQLAAAVPEGVDVDFENVGGPVMDAVLTHLNIGARVPLCGMISGYEAAGRGGPEMPGLRNVSMLIMRRARMEGFLVLDHVDRWPQAIGDLAGLLGEGRLHQESTVVDGFERVVEALGMLFEGANTGKLLVRVAEPSAGGAPDDAAAAAA